MPETSIVIAVRDNYSSALRSMRAAVSPLCKDISTLQGQIDKLNHTRASMDIDLTFAKREIREVEEAFDCAMRAAERLQNANLNVDNLISNLKLVRSSVEQTQCDMLDLSGVFTKASARSNIPTEKQTSGGTMQKVSSAAKELDNAGVFDMLTQTIVELQGTRWQSERGRSEAIHATSTLEGTLDGAKIGTIIAGPIGAAVGGVLGGLVGAAKGQNKIFAIRDDAFKSFVQEQTEARLQEQQDDLTSGSAIAAQREQEQMQQQYGSSGEWQDQTYDGMMSKLEELKANQQAAMGEGYNEKRKEGLQKEIDWYEGETGQEMLEANRAIGAWKAELENSKEGYIRGAMDVMLQSDEYVQAKADGNYAEMGRIMMEAKTKGIMQYNASEGAQQELDSILALAEAIRQDASTNDAYWDAGLRKSEEFSKGILDGMKSFNMEYLVENGMISTQDSDYYNFGRISNNGYAYGLRRVPYDNYPAILHYGERVLTANEARQQDSGGIGGVTVEISSLTVREQADIDRIASMLATKIAYARAAAIPS